MYFKLFAYLVAVIGSVYKHSNKKCDKTIDWLALESWNAQTIKQLTNDKSNHVNISQAHSQRDR